MEERIKALRKALGLTQQEFADRMGLKRNTVATYELGRSRPSDSAISLICRTFNVNETWLRTGEGEMFTEREDGMLEHLRQELQLSDSETEMFAVWLELPYEQRQKAIDFAREFMSQIQEAEKNMAAPDAPTPEERAIYEKVVAYDERMRAEAAEAAPPIASDSDTPDIPEDTEIEERVARYRAHEYAKKKVRETLTTSPPTAPFAIKKDPPR